MDGEKRQGGTDTAEALPDWMSYSAYTTANGEREYTIVNLPQTYYGPSIPLGTDGAYVFGGLSSPPPELPESAVPTSAAVSETSPAFAAPTSTALLPMSTVPSSSVTEAASVDAPATTGPLGTISFLSTLSGASVRSTSLEIELTSAVSDLSLASLASQSINSIFSQATSARSAFSTASDASTSSTASVRSASTVSTHSVATASAESTRSTASAGSSESTASRASTSSVFAASTSSVAEASRSSASIAATASPSSSPSPQSESGRLPTRDIIALSIGLFIAAVLLALLLVCFFRWRQRRRRAAAPPPRIPPERSHSLRRSLFTGENAPRDGRITVQGTVFDLWTPEHRAMRERQQQREAGSGPVTDWARRSMAFLTGSQSSRGSGGSRRVSRTQQNANAEETIGENTPLFGDQSPPLSPPPNSPPPFSSIWGPIPRHPNSPLPPVSLPFADPGGSSNATTAQHSRNDSGATLDHVDGDGEQETAQLLVARRATRGPAPRLGRLSWFRRMGLLGGASDEDGAGETEDERPLSPTQIAGPNELLDPRRMTGSTHQTGPSINTLLEMGYVADAFPTPPTNTTVRGPVSWGLGISAQRPLSILSTATMYHDAQSTLTPSRPTTPIATIPAPEPTTPPSRRRPVPPFLLHARPTSISFLGSRTDLLDSPVPTPLRRSYHAGLSSEGRPGAPPIPPPELDIANDLAPPLPAWRGSRTSGDTVMESEHSGGADEQEESRTQPSLRRFTFGYPLLVDESRSRPASQDAPALPPVSQPPMAEPPSLSSLRRHFNEFGFLPPRSVSGDDLEPSVLGGTSLDVPLGSTSISTPRSSVAFPGQDDVSSLGRMPMSAFGKPKAQSGWPIEHDI